MNRILLAGLILCLLTGSAYARDLVFTSELPGEYHKYDFDKPAGVCLDANGYMYAANTGKGCVQRFKPSGELDQEFYGQDEDRLSQPIGVTVDDKGNIYVADAYLKCVMGFDREGNVFGVWGKGDIGRPCGITVGRVNGNNSVLVYVTDTDNHCVWEFNGKNLGIHKIGGPGTFTSPTAIAFNPDNSMLYVVDAGNRIQKIFASTNPPGILGYKDNLEKLGTITGIAVNSGQFIYVAAEREAANETYVSIHSFDLDGIKKGEWSAKAGFGPGQFGDISGLFVDRSGMVFVADRQNNCIQKIKSGTFMGLLGKYSFEKGRFNSPVDMTFDSAGNMYVMDKNNHRIQKFNQNGGFIAAWGGKSSLLEPGLFDAPSGIAVDRNNNNRVYVVDCYNSRIQRLNNNGNYIDKWGKLGAGNGDFSYPQDIAIDSDGNAFVVDTANNRIQVFDRLGTFVTKWSVDGSPLDIEIIETNGVKEIYIVCHTGHEIRVYDETGGLLRTIGGQGPDEDAGQFQYPCGIAKDSSQRLYVLDRGNNCLHIMDRQGKNLGIWKWQTGMAQGEISLPEGIAIDDSDNIYIADTGNHRIQRFKPLDFVACGSLVGTVTNHGTPVHNARVELRQPETGAVIKSAYTNNGRYVIDEIPAGTYSVLVFKDGYGTGYASQAVPIRSNNVAAAPEVVLVPMISQEVDLHNYPNPFDPADGDRVGSGTTLTDGTIIFYNLSSSVNKVFLEVYNLAGELIWEWEGKATDCGSGEHRIPWDGRSRDGNIVGDGVYLCVLTAGDRVETCKMAVVK